MQKKQWTNCKHLFATQQMQSSASPDPVNHVHDARNKNKHTLFMIACDPPPTCGILTQTDEKSIADWRYNHQQYM